MQNILILSSREHAWNREIWIKRIGRHTKIQQLQHNWQKANINHSIYLQSYYIDDSTATITRFGMNWAAQWNVQKKQPPNKNEESISKIYNRSQMTAEQAAAD